MIREKKSLDLIYIICNSCIEKKIFKIKLKVYKLVSFEQNWSSGLANGELVKPENYFKGGGGPTVICVSEACFL